MQPDITAYHHAATGRVTYLVADPATLLCAIVDPVLDFDPATGETSTAFVDGIIADIREKDLGPTWILETGVHTGHLSAAGHLKYETGASVAIGAHVLESLQRLVPALGADGVDLEGWDFDKLAREDDEPLIMGGIEFHPIALSGRLPGAVAYKAGDVVFVGDALLPLGLATGLPDSDAPGADAAGLFADARKLLSLPDDTRLLSSWAGEDVAAADTTVAAQKAANPDAGDAVAEAEFVARRAGDKPAPSALTIAALDVAVRSGKLPYPDEAGVRFPSRNISSL
ncbi:MBL fold metallo-hydrolase [Caulobacter sp. D4A]|uniref:MBL fold metallo-hydrolase n=1 Tax=unclassified Caulobacter TaxID=2648921 RepID=UPI000D73A7E2|nr:MULTISPECIES: MBL fold metallo-hydrolase [unclassified Caulobacter]PXA91209.1 MBL fold metallo-hydrolase [Caulobacter sp. D4A]PXA96770.1 MBL fold metallo-hydrolase [Caulobacter sp. D5]